MTKAEREQIEAKAARVQRGAIRKMAVFAALFLAWQISYFLFFPDPHSTVRAVDLVRTIAFLAWVLVLLALFATGGAMFQRRKLRPFLDDERAVAIRATAYRSGFWAMIALCVIGYAATLIIDLRAADVVHLVLSGGVLAVLVTQVILDRN